MITFFWIIIAITYFTLSLINKYFHKKISKKYNESKEDFEKNYGFDTYNIFNIIEQYFILSFWISFIGGILASIVAFISAFL